MDRNRGYRGHGGHPGHPGHGYRGAMGPPNMSGPGPGHPHNLGMNMNNMGPGHGQINQMTGPGQGGSTMQDDFDGKRLRKSVMRKTVDYNSSVILALEQRLWARDWRDGRSLQPDAMYCPHLLPPPSYPQNPINAVTTRFVKTATNKQRCPIFTVAWTPEGRRLVTGASSGEFTLWNGLTFNFETILQAHDSPVRSMVWSRGEAWMVTGDHAGYVKYWQTNMNNVKMFQAHREAVRGISFSPTDSKIVTCSDDGTLRVFDFYRCQEERILRGHGADVKCVQWHPTKALIVSGSKDNQQPVKLWDPKTGKALATLHAHKSTVMDLKWNDNGNWLVTASRDHLLKLFDVRKLSQELQVFRGHKKEASSVAWHPTHEGLFCSGGSDGAVLFWNVGTDKEVGCIEDAHESIVWTLAWHPLGHILCSGSNDHTSKFWTRNRPGDLMRDKYNLNTLPQGVQDEQDYDDRATIPGMGPEDKVDLFASAEKAIPGLDLDTALVNLDSEKKGKKVPYSKPIPRNFQAQWNHGVDEGEILAQAIVETVPGVVPLQQIAPSAIIIYGKYVPVTPGSKLEAAIAEGPQALKKLIASGEIEEIHDVMPHTEDDDEEAPTQFVYPTDVQRESDGSNREYSEGGADGREGLEKYEDERDPNSLDITNVQYRTYEQPPPVQNREDYDDRNNYGGDRNYRSYNQDQQYNNTNRNFGDGQRNFQRGGARYQEQRPPYREEDDYSSKPPDSNDMGDSESSQRYRNDGNRGGRGGRWEYQQRPDDRGNNMNGHVRPGGDNFRGRGSSPMWRGGRGRGRMPNRPFRRPPRGNNPY